MRTKKFVKKVLSGILAIGVLSSVVIIPASVSAALPTTGVLWSWDFEEVEIKATDSETASGMKTNNPELYYNAAGGITVKEWTDEHKKAIGIPTNNAGQYTVVEGYIDGGNKQGQAVNTGVVVLSNDLYIPGDYSFEGESVNEVSVYMGNYLTNVYGYHYSVKVNEAGARVVFGTDTNIANEPVETDANTKSISTDVWHNIEIHIDYDNKKADYYVDGEKIAAYDAVDSSFAHYQKLDYICFGKAAKDGGRPVGAAASMTGEKPVVVWADNFKIERMDENAKFSAKISEVGENFVDVEFTRPIASADISGVTAKVNTVATGGTEIELTSPVKQNATTVRFSATGVSLAPGELYKLSFSKEVKAAYGGGGAEDKIKAGENLLFATSAGTTAATVDLIEKMTFDNLTVDKTNEIINGVDTRLFNDFWLVNEGTVNGDGTVSDKRYGGSFIDDKRYTYYYIANDSSKLGFSHDVSWMDRMGLKFPFTKPVDKGVVTIEFDAAIGDVTGISTLCFGLADTGAVYHQASDAYGMLLGSLKTTDTDSSLIKATNENRSWVVQKQKPDGGGERTEEEMATVIETHAVQKSIAANEMKHYKFVVDLDNKKYDIYYDNVATATASLNYFAGSSTATDFDAFTVVSKSKRTSGTDPAWYLDNLKITATTTIEQTAINAINFDGNGYTDVVSAGTREIKLGFTADMPSGAASMITLSGTGIDSNDYTVSCGGTAATITLKDGSYFMPGTAYTINIADDTVDTSGNEINGAGKAYPFTTDAGELTYDDAPAIEGITVTDGTYTGITGNVTAKINVTNTKNATGKVWIAIAAYKDDMLIGLYPISDADATLKNGANTYSATATAANLAEADEIAAYVFDGFTRIAPLADCVILTKAAQ